MVRAPRSPALCENPDPPASLVQWVAEDFAQLAGDVRKILEENGIDIQDDGT